MQYVSGHWWDFLKDIYEQMKRKSLLFVLFSLWGLLAAGSVGYNAINTYAEVKNWYFLTDTQKREKIFGDLYTFFVFLHSQIQKEKELLLFSKDVRTHYFGMYTFYPTVITDTSSEKTLLQLAKSKKFRFIGTYNKTFSLEGYEQIAFFSSKTSENFGMLYKRK